MQEEFDIFNEEHKDMEEIQLSESKPTKEFQHDTEFQEEMVLEGLEEIQINSVIKGRKSEDKSFLRREEVDDSQIQELEIKVTYKERKK